MSDERASTGITGFDRLSLGGFPQETLNLLAGPAGSGKSLFALHFAYHGAKSAGDPALYLTLEQPRTNMERVMDTFHMDLRPLEEKGLFFLIDLGEIRFGGRNGKSAMGFDVLENFLGTSLPTMGAKRVVIDSINAIGLQYATRQEFRERMFSFSRFLRDTKVTSLLVSESIEGEPSPLYGVEPFVADSFVHLSLEVTEDELRRTITIRKMRFTCHDAAEHPFRITEAGFEVAAAGDNYVEWPERFASRLGRDRGSAAAAMLRLWERTRKRLRAGPKACEGRQIPYVLRGLRGKRQRERRD